MKKLTLITLFVSAFAFITSAYAGLTGTVSGNAGVTSNYLFRGVSQAGGASVSGGLTYTDGALSLGASAYSLGEADADGADTEVNYVVSYAVNDALSVGATVYSYNGVAGSDRDGTEINVGYDLGVATISYASGSEGAIDGDTALALSYGFDIAEGVAGSLTYGDYSDDSDNAGDYDYLQLDISYENLTVSIVDADRTVNGVEDETEVAVSYSFNF
jgi:uncharacterized protein (TIGR02001 family)